MPSLYYGVILKLRLAGAPAILRLTGELVPPEKKGYCVLRPASRIVLRANNSVGIGKI